MPLVCNKDATWGCQSGLWDRGADTFMCYWFAHNINDIQYYHLKGFLLKSVYANNPRVMLAVGNFSIALYTLIENILITHQILFNSCD